MSAHDSDHDEHHGPEHYIQIWAVLLVLLAVSIIGPMFEIPWLTLITAFGIAVVKAGLVMKHFMHLNTEPKFILYMLATMLVFMFLFVAGTAPDVLRHEGHRWENEAARAEVERALAAEAESGGHH